MFFNFARRRFAHDAFHGGGRFEQTYRCYAASSAGRPQLEAGDKVILPASALHVLSSFNIQYPMLFELTNAAAAAQPQQRTSHCGVLEFVAGEGTVVMPDWMMENLRLQPGDAVRVRSAALPKGTYVKLQPHTSEFLGVSNPKAVLEKTLRSFSCFTVGDTIAVSYNGRRYCIDIVETKPASAVSIIDTDCEVDFAPPLDYKEPEPEKKPQQPVAAIVPASSKATAAEGGDEAAVTKDESKFKPFTGCGKRLDGRKASEPQASEAPSTAAGSSASSSDSNGRANKQQTSAASAAAASGASSSSSCQKTGKLVFGGSSASKLSDGNKEAQKAPEPPKKDEPKFQAFTGKSYSLQR